jgi:hypothetical protein
MAPKAKRRWSFAEDRRLIQLAASLKPLAAVAAELKRTPKNVARTSKRLGVSLKAGAGLKAKEMTNEETRHGGVPANQSPRHLGPS